MRQKSVYAERPPRVTITDCGDTSTLTFAVNVTEVALPPQDNDTTIGCCYQADVYNLTVLNVHDLAARIERDYDAWLQAAMTEDMHNAAAQARVQRNQLLVDTDYLLAADYPIAPDRLTVVKAYRQALRDISAQAGWPYDIVWPTLTD